MSRKHKHDHEDHIDESWLIPYADLLTLLLATFIVLYSMSSVDVKKFEELSQAFTLAFNSGSGVLDNPSITERGPQKDEIIVENPEDKKKKEEEARRQELMKKEQEDLEKLKKSLDTYIKKNGLMTELETKLNQSQLMITISDNALFASGSAVLRDDSKDLASAISKMLQQYPEYEIIVSGHTDNEPISTREFKSNWDLSSSRAIRFMDVLLQNPGLKPERFSAIGYGEYRPVSANTSVEGRAKNRRVEVSIIRKYIDQNAIEQIPATPKQ
ncbi:flagellar motor protein MotB [Paenibacillus radicis (ex Gao et al. 2016)]|uniref:Flagellar motor protein MotB n=1 Tax=Paenibacillus radicis (ex Gao et al. 2016) TaxID=1737354 RepID=A0A917HRE0_9BACL|nr:flagellar motor protein MotB [Paenibacillus radicis (ex Gao et al. 2016)]GGG87005.1 flagellar motor protein MotB [Paenibacillus radicis (ex Gao et al. 2016)]